MNSNPVPVPTNCNGSVASNPNFHCRSMQQIDLQVPKQYFAKQNMKQQSGTYHADETKSDISSETVPGRRRYQRRNSKVASMLFPVAEAIASGVTHATPKTSQHEPSSSATETRSSCKNPSELNKILELQGIYSIDEKDIVDCERKRASPSIPSFDVHEAKRQKTTSGHSE